MSSPKMTRMLGFLSADSADTTAANVTRTVAAICARRRAWLRHRKRGKRHGVRICFVLIIRVRWFCFVGWLLELLIGLFVNHQVAGGSRRKDENEDDGERKG